MLEISDTRQGKLAALCGVSSRKRTHEAWALELKTVHPGPLEPKCEPHVLDIDLIVFSVCAEEGFSFTLVQLLLLCSHSFLLDRNGILCQK